MKWGYADTLEGQVHYVEEGQGEPLLLLHQTPRSLHMFKNLIPLLSHRYRAIAIDMLGYGNSSPPPTDTDDAMMDLARNTVHFLDALNIERTHVLGWHTGSVVAVEAAAAWPQRVAALIIQYPLIETEEERERMLENTRTEVPRWGSANDGSHLTSLWMRAYGYLFRNWLHTARPPSPDWHRNPESLFSSVFHPGPSRGPDRFITPEQRKFLDQWVVDTMASSEHLLQLMLSLYSRDTKAPLTRIQSPTLHIEPDSPYEVYYNLRGNRVAELVPNCENFVLKGADDNAPDFVPAALAEVVLDFLGKHPL